MSAGGRAVRRSAVRVALLATAVVGAAYVVVVLAVMLIVTHNLTAEVDHRLAAVLARLAGRASPRGTAVSGPPEQRLNAPVLAWVLDANGTTESVFVVDAAGDAQQLGISPQLPNSIRTVNQPSTVRVGNNDVRVDGLAAGDGRIVVEQSLAHVDASQHNILVASLAIGPALLVAVFAGAYWVGRRTAAPIENARRRQIELTADASHELRTPLSVIEAQTALALERDRDPEWYRAAFERIRVEGARMRRLVDDLLWLARFDATGPAPPPEEVDLGIIATQATARFQSVAETRGLHLAVSVGPASSVVNAPAEWLDRLLGVLLDNACRYTPAGGSVDVRISRNDGRVRLAVEDSGPGIPESDRTKIFDRFHRASDAPGGAGLGLAIAAAVVGSTGGRWDIGTAAAGGASMAVSWSAAHRGDRETAPMSAAAADPEPAPPPPPPPPSQPMPVPPHR